MSGAVMNYDFGQKRHWRRWLWNRIAERAPAKRDGLVLYLPGEQDLDRPIAMTHGFRPGNLIGIEINAGVRRRLREKGNLVVGADFVSTVWAGAMSRRVDVVYADFCRGLHVDLMTQAWLWLANPAFNQTVFAFNLLCGREREPEIGQMRALAETPDRAYILAQFLCNAWATIDIPDEELADEASAGAALCLKRTEEMLAASDAATMSYRSASGQRFDSLVMRNPLGILWEGNARRYKQTILSRALERPGIQRAKLSLAAVMAHRTRRLAARP